MAPHMQQDTEMANLGNEAETREADLESLQPLRHRSTWSRSWKISVSNVFAAVEVNICLFPLGE
jgi:hypothetical protein